MNRIHEISLVMLVSALAGCSKNAPDGPGKPAGEVQKARATSDELSWDSVVGQELVVSYVGCPSDGNGKEAQHCHMKIETKDGQQSPHKAALSGGSGTFQFKVTTPRGTMDCESLTIPDGKPLELTGLCLINEEGMEGKPEHEVTATLDHDPDDESAPWIEVHFSHPAAAGDTKIHDGSAHVHPPKAQ